jgi:hypothetical protein
MDPAIIAAIIGGIGTFIAVYFGWWLQRDTRKKDNVENDTNGNVSLDETQRSADNFTQRYLEYPSHY